MQRHERQRSHKARLDELMIERLRAIDLIETALS